MYRGTRERFVVYPQSETPVRDLLADGGSTLEAQSSEPKAQSQFLPPPARARAA